MLERLRAIDERIADAARASGRELSDITRIVVTKFHPPELIRELYRLGVRDVGENRQQEYSAKTEALADLVDLNWHFIGQIQSKKAKAVRASATLVHSVDRERVADALDRAEGDSPLDVLVQINLTDDLGRGGVAPDDIEALATHIAGLSRLQLRGVMAVAPLDEPPASAFARLHEYRARVQRVVPGATWMSAGMTTDFAEAIAAGATHLRIGSAITGPRPVHG
nr:YggS family pyridoxal phosphate-dependent enzyme [Microbacterium halimionae]